MNNLLEITGRSRGRAGMAVLMAAFVSSVGAVGARADVTVVSTTTMSGAALGMMGGGRGAAPSNQPTTTSQTSYYKGRKVRTETRNAVVLFDGATGTTYTLDPAKKTYYPLSALGAVMNPMMAMIKMTTKATVRPTGATRVIAGHPAREYAFTANVEMTSNPQAMSPLGGAPKGARPMPPQHIGSIHAEGSEWVTTLASLPGGGNGAVKAGSAQIGNLMPGMKTLVDKLATIPGVPLAARQSMTFEFAMMGAGPGPGSPGKKPAMQINNSATSVREAPLPDSLFVIPPGYTLVSPTQGMGRPSGGMQRPGMTPTR